MAEEKHEKLVTIQDIDYQPPQKGWMETPVNFKKGTYCYSGGAKFVDYLDPPVSAGMEIIRR